MRFKDYWTGRLKRFYKKHNPFRLDEVETILERWQGKEEQLMEHLTLILGDEPEPIPPIPRVEVGDETPLGTIRYRLTRLYARYAEQQLYKLDEVLQTFKNQPEEMLQVAAAKYGQEVRGVPTEIRERVMIFYGYYGQMHKSNKIEQLMSFYSGKEQKLIDLLISEFGPEPSPYNDHDVVMDMRSRVHRYFFVYDKSRLTSVDNLLIEFKGREIELLLNLQRRYGVEPSKADVERASRAGPTTIKEESEEAADDEAASITARERLRGIVLAGSKIEQESLVRITRQVFADFDALLVPSSRELVDKRFNITDDSLEWATYLVERFAHEDPCVATMTLRRQVHLLHLWHGDRIQEIAQEGGPEKFLAQVILGSEEEWIVYFTQRYGPISETKVAARSRLVTHYRHYNRSAKEDDTVIDELLDTLLGNEVALHDSFEAEFGPEPPPPTVNQDRIANILRFHFPGLVRRIGTVIEAHTKFGYQEQDIVGSIAACYGSEPSRHDMDRLYFLLKEECEWRYNIFLTEMRLHGVITSQEEKIRQKLIDDRALKAMQRQAGSGEVNEDPAAVAAFQHHKAVAAVDKARRRMMKQSYSSTTEIVYDEKMQRDILINDEDRDRHVVTFSRHYTMTAKLLNDEGLADDEMFRRLSVEEQQCVPLVGIREKEQSERAELGAWLAERLPWRAKWDAYHRRKQELELESALQTQREIDDVLMEQVPVAYDNALDPATAIHRREYLRNNEQLLTTQVNKVLRYEAQVRDARREMKSIQQAPAKMPLTRGGPTRKHNDPTGDTAEELVIGGKRHKVHPGCALARERFSVAGNDYVVPEKGTLDAWMPKEDTTMEDDRRARAMYRTQCRDYIEALLSYYDPTQLNEVSAMMKQMAGREEELIETLERQFEHGKSRHVELHDRLVDYYAWYCPEKLDEVDTILDAFDGREDFMWDYLRSKYGPEPSLQNMQYVRYVKDRLLQYLTLRAPGKLPEAERMLKQCKDVNAMFRSLVDTYGAEEPDTVKEHLVKRLVAYYGNLARLKRTGRDARGHQQQLPIKSLPTIRQIARRYVGKENELNELLAAKYGVPLT